MKRTLLVVTTILGLFIPISATNAAQPSQFDQTFTSITTGIEFDLGPSGDITFLPGDYEIRDTPPVLGEYIWFTYHGSNFQVLLIGGANDTLSSHDATMGNMFDAYDSWVVIAEQIEVDFSWFIGEAQIGDQIIIVLYSFELDAYGDVDLMVMQFAQPGTLQSDLEFVQSQVTIGSGPLLSHIDAGAVAEVAGVELAMDQQRSTSQSQSGGEWESLGLLSNSEWQSPNHGLSIGWDVTLWEFPFDYELAITIEGEPPYDSISLERIDGTGYMFITVDAIFEDGNPNDLLEYWTSQDYLGNVRNGALLRASILTTTSAMIVYETVVDSGESRVVVQEATYLDNGTIVIAQMWGTPASIHQVYGAFVDGVFLNGQAVTPAGTVEDISDLFAH